VLALAGAGKDCEPVATENRDMVTVKLVGADLELLRAGKADGRAEGIGAVVDALEAAFATWRAAVLEEQPDGEQQVDAFLAGVRAHLDGWREQATQAATEKGRAMRRAIELGAGQPRGRTLLDCVRGAIVGGVAGWRGR